MAETTPQNQQPAKENSLTGFFTFIREQGIVGLAVGFLLGGSVSQVVQALVNDIIDPLIGLIIGAPDELSNAIWRIGSSEIRYGHFISTLIDFAIIAFVVYFVIKGLGFDKLDKKKA